MFYFKHEINQLLPVQLPVGLLGATGLPTQKWNLVYSCVNNPPNYTSHPQIKPLSCIYAAGFLPGLYEPLLIATRELAFVTLSPKSDYKLLTMIDFIKEKCDQRSDGRICSKISSNNTASNLLRYVFTSLNIWLPFIFSSRFWHSGHCKNKVLFAPSVCYKWACGVKWKKVEDRS